MKSEQHVPECHGDHRSRLMGLIVRSLRNIGVGTLLSISAVCLWGQASAAADAPFATLNASLEQTADGVLASAGRTDVANNSRPVNTLPASVATHYDNGLRRTAAGTASSRIALLRPVLDPILHEAGIPTELAAVVLVESGGDPMALSPKGARGLWQLMPDTARRYGLIVNDTEDDRLDVERSTRAAAHYLSDLYSEFGSWPLALAAYNTGEQNLQVAIERSRSTDFAVLSSLGLLPLETRNYVPAVFAAVTQLTNSPVAARLPMHWRQDTRTVFAVAERSN